MAGVCGVCGLIGFPGELEVEILVAATIGGTLLSALLEDVELRCKCIELVRLSLSKLWLSFMDWNRLSWFVVRLVLASGF
jgi:hypothetical protein